MPYTPSTAAQSIATAAGNNQAALTPAVTALQASITGGNLAPAALMDAIVSYLNSNTYIEIGSAGAPAFQNSWVNYGTPYNTAAYFKDACGIVRMKGMIKLGTLGAAAFVLPAGYRPSAQAPLATIANDGAVVNPGFLIVDSSGNVIPFSGGHNYFSLEVSFLATQ